MGGLSSGLAMPGDSTPKREDLASRDAENSLHAPPKSSSETTPGPPREPEQCCEATQAKEKQLSEVKVAGNAEAPADITGKKEQDAEGPPENKEETPLPAEGEEKVKSSTPADAELDSKKVCSIESGGDDGRLAEASQEIERSASGDAAVMAVVEDAAAASDVNAKTLTPVEVPAMEAPDTFAGYVEEAMATETDEPWLCQNCGFYNEVSPEACVLCDAPRSSAASRTAAAAAIAASVSAVQTASAEKPTTPSGRKVAKAKPAAAVGASSRKIGKQY